MVSMGEYTNTDLETDTATTSAIVHQQVQYRLEILRQVQTRLEVSNSGAPEDVSTLHSSAIRGLTLQYIDSHTTSSIPDRNSDVLIPGTAAEKARDWVLHVICLQFRKDHTARARDSGFLKSAIEKERRGRVDEWSDQERFFMAVTDVNLDTWEQRLQTAFLVALQGDFANRLTLVKNKASQHLERARRAKDAARKANDIRTRILDRILTECVDHFACAVPLSIIEDMREHSGPEAMCPICHHPFTDTNACSIEELLADFPVRIKYCGHIVGKSCLEQWMDTPKIDEAKYPDRSCPLCRVNIEGVAAPAVPAKTSDHVKRDLTAILNRRKLEEMGECDLEFAECLNAISACISEEIAVGELMAVLSTEKNQLNTRLEVQKAFLQEKLEMLKMERWIWGFRDNVAWKKARGEWMTSGVSGRI